MKLKSTNYFSHGCACSYLSEQEQYVLVNGACSERCHVLSGVPQGSVLGPLLFLIYINSVTEVPLSLATKLTLYAVDMLVYKPVHSESCYSHVHLQRNINNIFQWSQDNLMTFNTSKCKCMLLTNKRSIFPSTLTLNNQPLELVQQMKYLGLIVSHILSWSQHIQATCKKARKMLGIIYRQFQ